MPSSQQNVSARRRFPENGVSLDFQIPLLPVPQTHRCMFLRHRDLYLHVICHQKSEKTAFRNVRGQRKRDRILDRGPTSPTHCKAPGASQHGPVRCRRSGRQVVITTNPVDTLVTEQRQNGSYKCELWQKALSRLSQERQNKRRCEVFSPLQQSTESINFRRLPQGFPPVTDAERVRTNVRGACTWSTDSSKVCFFNKAFQGLEISPRAWRIHRTM